MKQRSISITDDVEAAIQEFADSERRSFSAMAGILLEQAIKERKRQREKRLREKKNNL